MPADAASSDKGDEEGSILDLPADYVAVQLIAMPSQASLDKFTARHRLHGLSAARVLADEQIRYVLLLGIYATREEAEAAASAAPPPFDSRDLWLRDVGSLQQAIRAADP
jgi:septal ring-binding cell division protein DamX